VGQALDDGQATDETGDHGLADPSQGKANHGDTELDAIDNFVEMLVETLHNAGADTSGVNELLDACIAHTHEGEFGGGEERIGCYQEEDQEDPEQHIGDH
jgi:hypothetical protein